jgi:hypothetical protein
MLIARTIFINRLNRPNCVGLRLESQPKPLGHKAKIGKKPVKRDANLTPLKKQAIQSR